MTFGNAIHYKITALLAVVARMGWCKRGEVGVYPGAHCLRKALSVTFTVLNPKFPARK